MPLGRRGFHRSSSVRRTSVYAERVFFGMRGFSRTGGFLIVACSSVSRRCRSRMAAMRLLELAVVHVPQFRRGGRAPRCRSSAQRAV